LNALEICSMSDRTRLSRRRVLAVAGVVAAGTAIGVVGPGTPAQAAPKAGAWTRRTTQNGWPVIDATKPTSRKIEGSNAVVTLLSGDVAVVLLYVARRFHYEVGTLGTGDVQGHTTDRTVGAPFESNYLSGTAIAIQAGRYPVRSAGNLFARDLAVIRDILAECEGVVRWGGDDKAAPKEGHFQIDVLPGDARLKRVAAKIRSWQEKPGTGAGSPADPFEDTRRSAAKALERKQKTA
jgi:hypothetical protein